MSFFFFINPKLHIRGGVNAVTVTAGAKVKKALCKDKERTKELKEEIDKFIGVHNKLKRDNANLKLLAKQIANRIIEMDEEEDIMLLFLLELCD